MKQKQNLYAALAFAALAAVGSPSTATASTTAGTAIVNVVTVDYTDATGDNAFSAAFSTTVTVNLVKTGLSVTNPPTGKDFIPGFNCVGLGSFASGDTFTAYYALTATANGQDNYSLSIESEAHNASASSASYTLLKADGTPLASTTSGASTRILNSAIVVGTSGSDTLLFPGGSLKAAANGGLVPGDIVVVDYGATKTPYLVSLVTLGNAKGYSKNGDVASTSTGTVTNETPDRVTVQAFVNNSLGFGGGGAAPAFVSTPPVIGTVVGQMVLAKVEVAATTSVIGAGNDAKVDYKLTTKDSDGGNPQYVGTATTSCEAGNFLTTQLSILKQVTNVTKNVGPVASTFGDPSDVLEYLVTVVNDGGQAASATVTDIIPSYTKLLTYDSGYKTGSTTDGTGYFAQISDGANTVDLTVDGSGQAAAQPTGNAPAVGFGKAAGVAAGKTLSFYLGHGSSDSQGGTVPSCIDSSKNTTTLCDTGWRRTYTIKYRVRID